MDNVDTQGGKSIRISDAFQHIIVLIIVIISIAVIPCLATDQISSGKDVTYNRAVSTLQFPSGWPTARHFSRSPGENVGKNRYSPQ
jgi:hypothetical protein